MRGKRSYQEQTRSRLLDLWSGQLEFGNPLGCVATTFTFDPALFEEQCLTRFLRIQSDPAETKRAYLIEREEKLSQGFACVLVDQRHVAANRSLRWQQLPVRVGGGVQHAKVSVLAWENCVRLLLGSANLTEPGYRRNLEHLAVFDFLDGAGTPHSLLRGCLSFLEEVRSFAPGAKRNEGPQPALKAFLDSVAVLIRSWREPQIDRDDPNAELIGLVPSHDVLGRPVLERLGERWRAAKPNQAWVISPFYDDGAKSLVAARALGDVMTNRGERSLNYAGSGRKLPDGTVELDLPVSLKEGPGNGFQVGFGYVPETVPLEGETVQRPLHTKSIWLERDDQAVYLLGSSNFTQAGLGLHPNHNIEMNVLYSFKKGTSFASQCEAGWPVVELVDDPNMASFLASKQLSDDDAVTALPLPECFGLALFRLMEGGATIDLDIVGQVPPGFQVAAQHGQVLLERSDWEVRGCPATMSIQWSAPRPPSALKVSWISSAGQAYAAPWIVNVADPAALAPPEELRDLSLAELLEVLTSTRPLYEVVSRMLERRERNKPEEGPELDPHRKVDTSGFLLQHMRRVSDALEGLRERLEQPVFSLDALRWRLFGPLGPLALGRRLSQSREEAAGFMCAEVAATLKSVSWKHGVALELQAICAERAKAIEELRILATERQMPPNLAAFVEAAFKECSS